MAHENLQLRNCADCTHYGERCIPAPNGCEHFSPAYKKPAPDPQQIYLDGWQAGFKAGAESVLRKRQTDSFDREEEAYNDRPMTDSEIAQECARRG
ncbi:MAG: hypothetical protein MJY71_08075 [Bacteroidaceae bacterium]|nr:hypothetical protein [Bacteroidaceae bacterium]